MPPTYRQCAPQSLFFSLLDGFRVVTSIIRLISRTKKKGPTTYSSPSIFTSCIYRVQLQRPQGRFFSNSSLPRMFSSCSAIASVRIPTDPAQSLSFFRGVSDTVHSIIWSRFLPIHLFYPHFPLGDVNTTCPRTLVVRLGQPLHNPISLKQFW